MSYEITVNTTFKIDSHEVVVFEDWIREMYDVVDFRFIPDTTEMYENDPTFRKLVKLEREARSAKLDYINEYWIDNMEDDE